MHDEVKVGLGIIGKIAFEWEGTVVPPVEICNTMYEELPELEKRRKKEERKR
jgi:hypothetical protein